MITDTNIVTAFYKYFAAKSDLEALIGENLSRYNLEKGDIFKSGESAMVISTNGGDKPRPNSLGNPRLVIKIYCDHTRSNGKVTAEDREEKAWAIFYLVDSYLHWKDHEPRTLDGIKILGCLRGAEPQWAKDEEAGGPYLWVPYDINYVM